MTPESLIQQLGETRLEHKLPDKKPMMGEHEAIAEANRCLYCSDAPCIPSCPTAINIPEFIRRISTGNLLGSARTVLSANIAGYSCARVCPVDVLCESTCVFNELGEKPIRIGALQRIATEEAYATNARLFTAGEDTGKRVALLGAGPASLACAHELRRMGHGAVIFEARSLPGGLNTTGVAPYKLWAEDSLREAEYILGIGGIEVRYETVVGKDVTLAELEAEFDAIFIGVGLGPDSRLKVPGEDLEGVVGAIEWIERLKGETGYQVPKNVSRVAVIGGGNTAIDVVREMCGLDVPEVILVYRRDEATKPGYAHEWRGARMEGATAKWNTVPVEVKGDGDGHVRALKCVRTEIVDGRVRALDGTEHEIACDMVLLAIGQSKLGSLFEHVEGIELEWGRIIADPATGRVGETRYFAGGDCANGGKEVVNAAAAGKVAAHGIDALISA